MPHAETGSPTRSAIFRPICIAHRGASGQEPENTLRAFSRALALDASWIELDIHRCEDRLVVLHDDRVDRTTDGHGFVRQFTLGALRRLDAGHGERIPFLEEVLDLVSARAHVNIELKGDGTAELLATVLASVVGTGGWKPEHFVVSSFDWSWLQVVRDHDPRLPLAPLTSARENTDVLEAAVRIGAQAVHVGKWAVRSGFVRDAHRRDLRVRVFTVNDRWEYEFMRRLGVDGIFTDFPDRVLDWSRQRPWVGTRH